MDETLRHHNPNPTLKANWLSKIFFWWMNPLFKTGYVRQLEVDDMYNVVPEEHSEKLGARLEEEWSKELERTKDGKRKPSLFRALFRMFGLEYILLGFVLFLEEGTKVIQPLLLGGLIRYFTPNSTVSRSEAYLYAGGVSLCAIVLAISHHPYFFGVQRIGMKMRVACCSLIYRKSLRLSNAGLGKTTTGQIVNLMSNDVNRFDQAVIFLHFLWVGPIEAIAILAILWRELGPSTLAGFAVLLLLVPVQGWMGKLFSKFRQKTAKYTDERVRLMNEIIAGMRVIKMYCWEKPFGDLVEKVRRFETWNQRINCYLWSIWISFRFSAQFISFCVSMAAVIITQRPFSVTNLYVGLSSQVLLSRAMIALIPLLVRSLAEMNVILERIKIKWLKKIRWVEAMFQTLAVLGRHYCISAVTLTLYLIGRPLRSTNLFVSHAAIAQLRVCVLRFMQYAYFELMQLRVSWYRMEVKWLKKIRWLEAVFETMASFGRFYCLYAVTISLFLIGRPLRSTNLYVSLAAIHQLRICVLRFMQYAYYDLMQMRVSWVRIEVFLYRKQISWVLRRTFIAVNFFLCDIYGTKLALIINFGMFIALGKQLSARKVYILYNILSRFTEAVVFRMIVVNRTFMKDLSVTISRVQTFLLLDELPTERVGEAQDEEESLPPLDQCFIEIDNVTARWDPEVDQATLHKVTASVNPGKLLAVIGPVGAGKSSLLMSVLKELPTLEGSVKVKGRIAYVAQQPWVFSGTLRQNVVFGNKYEKAKYDRILKACALNKDVNIMPHGDLTLIGDRGVSLSGGQKARVSLARALYMDADVYLLDDPLSAVDASVGRHMFDKVIQGVLKSKPRILVTHQLQYLKEAEEILILKEGEMIGKGTFDELSVSGIDFSSLLKREDEEEDLSPVGSPVSLLGHDPNRHPLDMRNGHLHGHLTKRIRMDSNCSAASTKDVADVGSMLSLTSIGTAFEAETVQLPEEEERHEGTVGASVYVKYFKAGAGILKFLLLAFLCVGAQCAYVMSDWWLSKWSNEEEARYSAMMIDEQIRNEGNNVTITNITIPYVDTRFNISVFSGIIASVFLLGLLRALMFFKVAVDASQQLHNKMFTSILRSHIGFFDTNPVGRILNRFSKDIGHMDDNLPITFFDFVQCGLLILGIVVVAGVVNPWVFIPVVPLIVLFVIIRRYYLRTSRHIKRLEGTTRSPVFSHLSASLLGLQTIRAFGVQGKFVEEFDNHQDLHTESWFLFLTASRWLAVRLDWLCALFVAAVSFSCVLASESLSAGLVGLSMTYAMTLMGMFQWGVRQSAEVENQMISVERVLAYMNLPSEAPLEVEEKKQPPSDWPQNGVISLQNASLRYSPDAPLVLKDLNFTIGAKEKVGIVGRTGAGKSSLITMLFRLVEPSGSILIDDINIQNIGLHDLRNKISIIPQDPVLFTGTLRRNLDPFSNHGDDVLWKSLEEVQLKQAIEDLPHGLDTEVSEGGINFSVGQRQLICLARAILRNNHILMIDEATANVDPRTDGLIQETIREKFNNCTVLTIAHRLNTIMDSDRLLLLDEGRVAEFDIPYLLMQKRDGIFRKLVEQTGKAETMQLLDIAKKAYEKKIAGNHPVASPDEVEPEIINDPSSGGDSSDVSKENSDNEEKKSVDGEMSASSIKDGPKGKIDGQEGKGGKEKGVDGEMSPSSIKDSPKGEIDGQEGKEKEKETPEEPDTEEDDKQMEMDNDTVEDTEQDAEETTHLIEEAGKLDGEGENTSKSVDTETEDNDVPEHPDEGQESQALLKHDS